MYRDVFAKQYDMLMAGYDYERITAFILSAVDCETHPTLLDTACGTGTFSLAFALEGGFNVEAFDQSEEMLTMAAARALEQHASISFFQLDLLASWPRTYDVVTCLCDGVNYLLDQQALMTFFKNAWTHLNEEGWLFIEVSTAYKLSEVLGCSVIAESFDDMAYIWENQYDEEAELLDFRLTFFSKCENTAYYERMEEVHTQRGHTIDAYRAAWQGLFKERWIIDSETGEACGETTERMLIGLQKGGHDE